MSFPRHGEIYRSDESNPGRSRNAAFCQTAPGPGRQARRKARAWLIVHDEFPVGYSLAGCSPAEPASASPTAPSMPWVDSAGNRMPANGNLSLVSVPQPRGSVHWLLSPVSTFVPGFHVFHCFPPVPGARAPGFSNGHRCGLLLAIEAFLGRARSGLA
jgi:hypothetical protein